MSDRQFKPCPICSILSPYWDRHPRLVCSTCRSKACDSQGRKVQFFNNSIDEGVEGVVVDTQEEYPSQVCYIEGVECWAEEGRFGGIAIEVCD